MNDLFEPTPTPAPRPRAITWRDRTLSEHHRDWRLIVDGAPTPWFISKSRFDRGPGGARYRLLGAGMDPSGCAGAFGYESTLKKAKQRLLDMAELDVTDVREKLDGNTKWIVGDKVAMRDRSFAFGRRTGVLTRLTTGNTCDVHWDGESAPSLQWLPRIALRSALALPQPPAAA